MGFLIPVALGLLFGFGTHEICSIAILPVYAIALKSKHKVINVLLFYTFALLPALLASYDYSGALYWSLIAYLIPLIVNVVVIGAAVTRKRFAELGMMMGIVVLSLPPMAGISLVSPLPTAGALFPGSGIYGIGLLLALVYISFYYRELFIACLILCFAIMQSIPISVAKGQGIDTYRGVDEPGYEEINQINYRLDEFNAALESTASYVVFPESAFGDNIAIAEHSFSDKPILGGARMKLLGDKYVNTLVTGGEILYHQQQPIPIGFGRKKYAVGYTSYINNMDEKRYYPALICIEISNPWLAMKTFHKADKDVIWISNLGWTRHGSLPERLLMQTRLYSRLFNKPVITAINYPKREVT